jgi:hypothetical protein
MRTSILRLSTCPTARARNEYSRAWCRATDKTGPLATIGSGPLADEEGQSMEGSLRPLSRGRGELPRREVMQTPDEVAAMRRLKASG